jgi:uncharacterized protein YjiS (DUF1127 family)
MATIISLPPTPAGRVRPGLLAAWLPGPAARRLLGAVADVIRRELVARELRRLDDRLLRDIRLDRKDIAGPSCVTVAWDAATGTYLLLGVAAR